jgi:hypothetical protein
MKQSQVLSFIHSKIFFIGLIGLKVSGTVYPYFCFPLLFWKSVENSANKTFCCGEYKGLSTTMEFSNHSKLPADPKSVAGIRLRTDSTFSDSHDITGFYYTSSVYSLTLCGLLGMGKCWLRILSVKQRRFIPQSIVCSFFLGLCHEWIFATFLSYVLLLPLYFIFPHLLMVIGRCMFSITRLYLKLVSAALSHIYMLFFHMTIHHTSGT